MRNAEGSHDGASEASPKGRNRSSAGRVRPQRLVGIAERYDFDGTPRHRSDVAVDAEPTLEGQRHGRTDWPGSTAKAAHGSGDRSKAKPRSRRRQKPLYESRGQS